MGGENSSGYRGKKELENRDCVSVACGQSDELPSDANAGGAGSILGWGPKFLHALRPKNQNIKQKQYCNKSNKDFKNDPQQQQKS